MEDIEKRLRETADNCISTFATWAKNKKDGQARTGLLEAIHELRKVTSRLEIEMAVSERDEMTQRPIPIPPHRDAKRRHPQEHEDAGPGNEIESDFRPPQSNNSNNNPRRHRPQQLQHRSSKPAGHE